MYVYVECWKGKEIEKDKKYIHTFYEKEIGDSLLSGKLHVDQCCMIRWLLPTPGTQLTGPRFTAINFYSSILTTWPNSPLTKQLTHNFQGRKRNENYCMSKCEQFPWSEPSNERTRPIGCKAWYVAFVYTQNFTRGA